MIFDIAAGAIMLLSIFRGWSKGFISDIISNVFLLIGLVIGFLFGNTLGTYVLGIWDITFPLLASILGFFVIFSLVVVLGGIIAKFSHGQADKAGLSAQDRLIGLIYGGIRGALIVFAILILARPTLESRGILDNSHSLPFLIPLEQEITPYINKLIQDTKDDSQVNTILESRRI